MHEAERVLVVGGTRGTGLLIANLLLRATAFARWPVIQLRLPYGLARRWMLCLGT
jgi:hypothetical protein